MHFCIKLLHFLSIEWTSSIVEEWQKLNIFVVGKATGKAGTVRSRGVVAEYSKMFKTLIIFVDGAFPVNRQHSLNVKQVVYSEHLLPLELGK